MLGRPFWIFGHFLFGIFCLCPNVLHDFTNTYGRISINFGRIFYLFYNVIKQIQIWKLERNFNYSCSDVLFLRRFVYKIKNINKQLTKKSTKKNFLFSVSCTWILLNVLLTIIIEAFEKVKDELNAKGNQYEILDFVKIQSRYRMGTEKLPPRGMIFFQVTIQFSSCFANYLSQ